ncbi:MAG TPA: hypothetical protein VEC38_08380 [Candidatus Binataceae bacterium]|nr:hypothetical protein [Candidatus Binataceae bacterium]
MKPDERLVLKSSRAFAVLAMRHPRASLHVAAIVQGAESGPSYAWVQCLDCAADFDFEKDGEWRLAGAPASELGRELRAGNPANTN